DVFDNVAYSGADTFTGGGASHQDTYHLNWYSGSGAIAEITDFQTGQNGDLIDLNEVIGQFTNYSTGSNPFLDGHLRLILGGNGLTLLQVDADGSSGPGGWQTVAKFDGHSPGDFGIYNFTPSFSPDGIGLHIVG